MVVAQKIKEKSEKGGFPLNDHLCLNCEGHWDCYSVLKVAMGFLEETEGFKMSHRTLLVQTTDTSLIINLLNDNNGRYNWPTFL